MRVDFQVSDPLTPEGNEKCGHLGVNGRLIGGIRCPGHPGRGKQEGEGPQSTGHSISGHEIQHGDELHRYWIRTELETVCPSSLESYLTSLGPSYLIRGSRYLI